MGQESQNPNFSSENSQSTIIQTDANVQNGQDKCPKCGSTDISLNTGNGNLRCNYCRYEFSSEKVVALETEIDQLNGQVIGSGAQDIIADTNDVMTFKCSSCGAEVVIDTNSTTQARCHWCRNTLSVNQQIPNGVIPDVVLPFHISKDDAKEQIQKFVGKRKFYAHPQFKKQFTTENIMGVYFPYMVVDINSHAHLSGEGEHQVRSYIKGSEEHQKTYYDADLYHVEREFDLAIQGLTIESNSKRLNQQDVNQTNNVINAIMPFDIENCVQYNANYLKDYTSEKRDANIEQLKTLIDEQAKDVARFSANDTIKEYDRGVAWKQEELAVKGERWKTAYLPVWIYSYQQHKGNKSVLHYVAVNARTKETMGSVPIHLPKLLFVSLLIEMLSVFIMTQGSSSCDWLFSLVGIIYFLWMYVRYRNIHARHQYETETKTQVTNLKKIDHLLNRRTGLTNSKMQGANNRSLRTNDSVGKMIDSLVEQDEFVSLIKKSIDKTGGNL